MGPRGLHGLGEGEKGVCWRHSLVGIWVGKIPNRVGNDTAWSAWCEQIAALHVVAFLEIDADEPSVHHRLYGHGVERAGTAKAIEIAGTKA